MKNFILAARPKTLLAGIIPPLVTYAYFVSTNQGQALYYLFLTVFGALFIQLATNFFNDVIDFEKGADHNRVGPTRVSAAGLVEIATVKKWAVMCIIFAIFCGLPIIFRGGWPFFLLGLISLVLTFGYTGGKISLAYRGLGELFVFLFFGLFSVLGSYYLFSLKLDTGAFILAIIFGLLTMTFICVNNLRDRKTDGEVGKRTLATKVSLRFYRRIILFTIFMPYVLVIYFYNLKGFLLIYLALIPAMKLTKIVMKKEGAELNAGLKFSGIHLVAFSTFLSFTFFYESFL